MKIRAPTRLHLAWILLLGIDVAIQLLMKLAGDSLHAIPFGIEWFRAALVSWQAWAALAGYLATFVLWLAILHAGPLSAAFPATALVYVLVPLAGWFVLREDFSAMQAAGIALILAGTILQRDARRTD